MIGDLCLLFNLPVAPSRIEGIMSNLFEIFPRNHPVFAGGRYLSAFDHLHDIDHFEHSILTYLGSLMPYDKGFVDHPAFPSIATISRATKICESTIRKKIRQLERKGYIKVKAVRFLAAVNGKPSTNLVWKDTALIPKGARMDIILENSNPGKWMAHCHISEHMEANMMFHFNVNP
jgi:hypothetical protein